MRKKLVFVSVICIVLVLLMAIAPNAALATGEQNGETPMWGHPPPDSPGIEHCPSIRCICILYGCTW